MATEGEDQTVEYVPRQYQRDLCESAKNQNIIAVLGTGTGKTFISILLIAEKFAPELRGSFKKKEAKRVFFLVPTKPLAHQQEQAIRYAAQTSDLKVKRFTGDMNVDFWNKSKWDEELEKAQVIVMTGQILLNMLNHQYITFDDICLLVIDEVHWAAKKKDGKETGHPYKQIMNRYAEWPKHKRPRVLGLSATPINCAMKLYNFNEAISDIEHTYLAICRTGDAGNWGTNPKELIWSYTCCKTCSSPTALVIIPSLDKFIIFLNKYKNKQQVPVTVGRLNKCLTNIRKMLTTRDDLTIQDEQLGQKFSIPMAWMGTWCASMCINKYAEELDNLKELYIKVDEQHGLMFDLASKYLNFIKQILDFELGSDTDAALNTASPKMDRLLELLDRFRPSLGKESDICGIIFVNQRCVAKVMSEWLKELKRIDSNRYGFLEVDAVVGHSARPGFEAKLVSNSDRQQQLVIERFHKKELNLLVATSVLEEGLDVRKCNLVVRYDRLNTFREYLQSKGRARADQARFYMMTSKEDEAKLEKQLRDFREMENMVKNLNSRSSSRLNRYESANGPVNFDRFFISKETNARITERTAIQMLYWYCENLPSDHFTRLQPVFHIDEIGHNLGFKAKVELPVNCPLRDKVIEAIAANKVEAKRAVALKACEELYRCGELDANLLPINNEQLIEKFIDELGLNKKTFEENTKTMKDGEHKVGTRSRRQSVAKRFANIFTKSQRNGYFLNRIDFASKRRLSFGILTTEPIHNECEFSVHHMKLESMAENQVNSENEVKLIPMTHILLNEVEVNAIKNFHVFTFEKVLRLSVENQNFDINSSKFNLLVVPIAENKDIDFNFIEKVNNELAQEMNGIERLNDINRTKYVFNPNSFEDTIFYPLYRTVDDKAILYFALQITDLTVNSRWEGKDNRAETFDQYFRKNHRINVIHKDNNLIHGHPVPSSKKGKFNGAQLLPYNPSSKVKERELFPPELLAIHPFPASLLSQALCLPAVLYRLNHLLLAEELRFLIHSTPNTKCLKIENTFKTECKPKRPSLDISIDKINIVSTDEDEEGIRYGNPFDNRFRIRSPTKKMKTTLEVLRNSSASTSSISHNIFGQSSSFSRQNIDLANMLSLKTITWINEFEVLIDNYIKNFNKQANNDILEEFLREAELQELQEESTEDLVYGEAFPFVSRGDISPHIRGTYDDKNGDHIFIPEAGTLLKALTLTSASDAFNLERYEVLGDSFLKLVSSTFVYFSCPELDEGRLSYLKMIQICNCNLYHIGVVKGIDKLLVAHKWYPNQNWLLPGYDLPDETDLRLMENNIHKCGSFKHQLINDKSVADSVEALIGAHLLVQDDSRITRFSTKSALKFMEWLGLKVCPKEHKINYDENLSPNQIFKWLPKPKDPIVRRDERTDDEINEFFERHYFGPNLSAFEEIIGYEFRIKAYLIQALTHSSYLDNKFTDCYQKLEFLGDAILDHLITCHIYNTPNKEFNPGELTDLRSALVNNSFFAAIAVKYKFNKFLKNMSSDLFHAIQAFEKNFFAEGQVDGVKNSINQMSEKECANREEIEVPKALGDIFESVAAAIWMDNGFSLDGVWKVYFRMLKPEIDYFTANIPKMPVKQLQETCREVEFYKSEEIECKIRVKVKADGKEYSGLGPNRKLAKIAAAKCALKSMKDIKSL